MNLPTLDGRRFHRWKVSDIFHLDSQAGPSAGSASQICCRERASQVPNWISLGFVTLYVEAFTDGLTASGYFLDFQIKHFAVYLIYQGEAREVEIRSKEYNVLSRQEDNNEPPLGPL